MGARVLSGLQGNVDVPAPIRQASVTWQAGENVGVTAADQTLGQLSMTPKTCIAITDISEQLLAQTSPSAEAFVMADLAKNVAIDGVDNAVDQRHGRRAAAGHQEHHRHHVGTGRILGDLREDSRLRVDGGCGERDPRQSRASSRRRPAPRG
jgi:hypothetical protein